jgi:predicted acylesterase/phospholipase RssA
MKHLAIGPGALGYFALLGAMDRLWKDKRLDTIESISGSSAGALVAFMSLYTNFDFNKALKISMKVPVYKLKPDIKNFLTSYGFVSQGVMRKMIEDVIEPMTFADLYARNPIKLHIASFCIELNKTFYFSVDTTPTMSIIDALCMSIAVPFLFSTFKYGPFNYFDGGAVESAPCGHLLGNKSEDVCILQLRYNEGEATTNNFMDYLGFVFNSYLKLRKKYNFPVVSVDLSDANVLDFGLKDVIKLKFYTTGYNFLS